MHSQIPERIFKDQLKQRNYPKQMFQRRLIDEKPMDRLFEDCKLEVIEVVLEKYVSVCGRLVCKCWCFVTTLEKRI